jgi:hypothetical protein
MYEVSMSHSTYLDLVGKEPLQYILIYFSFIRFSMYFSYFSKPEDSPQKNTSIRNAIRMFKVDSNYPTSTFMARNMTGSIHALRKVDAKPFGWTKTGS